MKKLIFLPFFLLLFGCMEVETYKVQYRTHLYYFEDNTYRSSSDTLELTLEALSEKRAQEQTRSLLYLNCLSLGDSIEIINIEKL